MIAIKACYVSQAIMIPSLSTMATAITRTQPFRASCNRYQHLPQQPHQAEDTSLVPKPTGHETGVITDRKMQLVLCGSQVSGAPCPLHWYNLPIVRRSDWRRRTIQVRTKGYEFCLHHVHGVWTGSAACYMMENLGIAPSHAKETGGQGSQEEDMEMVRLLSGLLFLLGGMTTVVSGTVAQWKKPTTS
jgi:hypothetical protein